MLWRKFDLQHNAPVKLFCPHPPRVAPGQRKKFVIKKGRGIEKWSELYNEGIKVIKLGRGKVEIKW